MAISDAIKRLISAFDPSKDPKAVPGESIEAAIDQLADTVKNLPEPSGASGSIYLDCESLPKPKIDGVEYDEIYIIGDGEFRKVQAFILDVDSAKQLPPNIAYAWEYDNEGKCVAIAFSPADYVYDVLQGYDPDDSLVDPPTIGGLYLRGSSGAWCGFVVNNDNMIALFPSSAQFIFVGGR